jgi:hypothetical protein
MMKGFQITKDAVIAERLRRQLLDQPLKKKAELPELFRKLQPVAPLAYSYPGSPPRLKHRTTFDDGEALDDLRGSREIVKGRFLGGRIGYVRASDLELYGAAFRKPLRELNDTQHRVMDAVQEIGPADTNQIKELVDGDGGAPLLKKQIMPALHRMQEAFLVFEDQTKTDWARPWADFESELTDVDLDRLSWEQAAGEVVGRFLDAMVFATLQQVKDWSGWALSRTKKLMSALEAEGTVVPCEIDGLGEGWLRENTQYDSAIVQTSHMIHRADFLAYAHSSELKERYKDLEVLQYLLIDGAFKGAVLGHWRIGPHDVDDVIVELPKKERSARKGEILAAVKDVYSGRNHEIICYDGREL